MLVWTCCEHQTNKQTNKEKNRAEFSNVKMPIAHHISVCFHVDGYFFFSTLFVVVCWCCYCAIYLHSTRERRWLFTVLQFYFLLSTTLGARSLVFRIHHLLRGRRGHSVFLFRQFNQSLDQRLDFKQTTAYREETRRFFFHYGSKMRRVSSRLSFFSSVSIQLFKDRVLYVLLHIARRWPSNVDSIEIQHR